MTSLTNIATANNTVAILIDSTIAKDISKEYGVDPKRTASLLDIFACAFQGILPYGAQILFGLRSYGESEQPVPGKSRSAGISSS